MENKRQGILSIGGRGLVGSRVPELLSSEFVIESVGNSDGVDITNPDSLDETIGKSEHEVVLLLAAKADVDGCEQDKALGEEGAAWKINVLGTANVVEACKKYHKRLVYVSTDFVFDGEKPEGEAYTEEDSPNPVNWYGTTKYEGEKIVQDSGLASCTVRLAYPYRAVYEQKKDFVRAIMGRLQQQLPVTAIIDHTFTPTFIDDFVFAMRALVEQNATGIYHVVGSQSLTPYEATREIANVFEYNAALISQTTREEFFVKRAKRPFNLAISNAKIQQLGITMKTFHDGLVEMKNQL